MATEKGLNVIRLLGEHKLTSPSLTGDWEQRLGMIEHGEEPREKFMHDIALFAGETVQDLDAKLKDVRIPRANLGPVPRVRAATSSRTARASRAGRARIPAAGS